MRNKSLVFILILLASFSTWAEESEESQVDTDYSESLAESLKIEANFNLKRLKSFKTENAANDIYEEEREKGLGEFLEDQEKWDLLRDRGLRDYRSEKRATAMNEMSPEYKEYLKEKYRAEDKYENTRETHVKTRDKVKAEQSSEVYKLEKEELQLTLNRPRYELRKRSTNKWVASGSKNSGTGSSGGGFNSGGYQSNLPPVNEYIPPAPDYSPAPAPYEGFDEMQPAPAYDNVNNGVPFDPAFGGDMSIPPPPPPPPDYDF